MNEELSVADELYRLSCWVLPAMAAIILHEIAHGYAALYFGDDTAKKEGRLSLNPFKHVDPFGTVIFPLFLVLVHAPFMFGWAKPVPVDFSKLKKPLKRCSLRALRRRGPPAILLRLFYVWLCCLYVNIQAIYRRFGFRWFWSIRCCLTCL